MLSVGKLFAIAAIVALVLGFARWPTFGTGFYAITIKNRVYGFGPDYWAFSVGAIFALFAASYYWFPIFFSRSMNSQISLLHFWLSALAAFAFLLLAPVIHALTSPRDTAVSNDRAMTIVLAIAVSSAILFLVAQIVFMARVECIFGEDNWAMSLLAQAGTWVGNPLTTREIFRRRPAKSRRAIL